MAHFIKLHTLEGAEMLFNLDESEYYGDAPDMGFYEYEGVDLTGNGGVGDINADGNYMGSEDYGSFMGAYGGSYSKDPFMMQDIDGKFWHQRWRASNWDSGANYPTGPQLSNNPDLDYDTLKLMHERGELLPWAEKYHDISANELEMFFDTASFGQDPEYDPFMAEYGTYDFAVEEAGTTLTDEQTAAYDIRSPQMRQLGIDKAEGLSALGKAESIKGVQSGFAGGGGFMKGIEKQKQDILSGYEVDTGSVRDIYEGSMSTAQSNYTGAIDTAESTLETDITTQKENYINQFILAMGS